MPHQTPSTLLPQIEGPRQERNQGEDVHAYQTNLSNLLLSTNLSNLMCLTLHSVLHFQSALIMYAGHIFNPLMPMQIER
jgi:hypothetical protein